MPHVDKPVRGLFNTITAWFRARGRAAADRDALARMSDRELCDIGLGCLSGKYAADRAFVGTLPG